MIILDITINFYERRDTPKSAPGLVLVQAIPVAGVCWVVLYPMSRGTQKIVARPPTVLLANNAPMSSSTFDGANPGVGVGWVRLLMFIIEVPKSTRVRAQRISKS